MFRTPALPATGRPRADAGRVLLGGGRRGHQGRDLPGVLKGTESEGALNDWHMLRGLW